MPRKGLWVQIPCPPLHKALRNNELRKAFPCADSANFSLLTILLTFWMTIGRLRDLGVSFPETSENQPLYARRPSQAIRRRPSQAIRRRPLQDPAPAPAIPPATNRPGRKDRYRPPGLRSRRDPQRPAESRWSPLNPHRPGGTPLLPPPNLIST